MQFSKYMADTENTVSNVTNLRPNDPTLWIVDGNPHPQVEVILVKL